MKHGRILVEMSDNDIKETEFILSTCAYFVNNQRMFGFGLNTEGKKNRRDILFHFA